MKDVGIDIGESEPPGLYIGCIRHFGSFQAEVPVVNTMDMLEDKSKEAAVAEVAEAAPARAVRRTEEKKQTKSGK